MTTAFLSLGVCFRSAPAESPPPPQSTVDALVAVKAYQGLVEEHLLGILRAQKTLALTSDARSAQWPTLKPSLRILSEALGTDAAVWFAQPDGAYYTVTDDLASENLKERAYFPDLLAGRDVLGSLVISKSTGHRSIIVATPVIEKGAVVGAIGTSVRSRLISQRVDEMTGLPETAYFYALAADQQIILHRNPDRLFKHPVDIDPTLKPVFDPVMTQAQGSFRYTLEGKSLHAVFHKSQRTGWHFFLVQESR